MYEAFDLSEAHDLTPEASLKRALSERDDLAPAQREKLLSNALASWPHFMQATKPPAHSTDSTAKELHLEASMLGG